MNELNNKNKNQVQKILIFFPPTNMDHVVKIKSTNLAGG